MKIACIGGAHVDRHGLLKAPPVPATSNPGNISTDFGGVARNVAENLARLGREVVLVSRVGDDESGRAVVEHLRALGVDVSAVTFASRATASYTAILEPDGELVIGFADMDIYDELTPAVIEPAMPLLRECAIWFAEANLSEATLAWLAREQHSVLSADAVSVAKSRKLAPILNDISPLFLNRAQAQVLGDVTLTALAGVLTGGRDGVAAWCNGKRRAMPAFPATARDVTGAGDALVAGTLFGLSGGLIGVPGERGFFGAVQLGLAAAAITVESHFTVSPGLTAESVYARLAANRA